MLGSRLLHGCVLKKLARRFTVIMCMTFYNGVSVAGGGVVCAVWRRLPRARNLV